METMESMQPMLLQNTTLEQLIDQSPKQQQVVEEGLTLIGLKPTTPRLLLYIFLCVITGGIFLILSAFLPLWRSRVIYTRVPLGAAKRVLIKRKEEGTWMYDFKTVQEDPLGYKYFEYMCIRYIYDSSSGVFEKPRDLGRGVENNEVLRERYAIYGRNSLDIPIPSYLSLLISEIFHPFYIFQVFSCAVWYWDSYWIYASCILVMSTISAIISVRQTKKNRIKLANMVHAGCQITCIRGGQPVRIHSTELVPGDVVQLEPDITIPCDMILISGNAVVNESSLTGESIPIPKSPLPPEKEHGFDPDHHSKHMLFNGTELLQVKAMKNTPVLALVLATGFATQKGELIRSVMYPKPTKFKFYRDSLRFVLFLAVLAGMGFIYTVGLFWYFGAPVDIILKRALDLITISVPPALPVAMTIGTAFAVMRLKKERVYCTAPSKVNVSGRVSKMCFDKTGTICEDGLSVLGVRQAHNGHFDDHVLPDISKAPAPLIWTLASCHTLNLHGTRIIGDPLDIEMFDATHWTLTEDPVTSRIVVSSPPNTEQIEILKYFEFSSLLQRQSVIVRHNDDLYLFAKGSPEAIKSLAVESTIPRDFDSVLAKYANQGKRVIAMALRKLGSVSDTEATEAALRKSRQEMECELHFLALLIMQNKLRPDSTEVIKNLQRGNIWNTMVTGDNEYTAINIARQCGIIPPNQTVYLVTMRENPDGTEEPSYVLVPDEAEDNTPIHVGAPLDNNLPFSWYDEKISVAVHGKAFQYLKTYDANVFTLMLNKACVYARMSPIHKTQLIEGLQSLNYTVGMCGDGANDCGALKAADVGVSLSDAEASVAAPFTSKRPTIASVFTLIREGRCALATSIQVYKYMAVYSLLQSISIVILYSVHYESRLKDGQFLWIDLVLIFPLSFLMSRTHPRAKLSRHKPPESLLAKSIVVSILLQMIIHGLFQVGAFLFTKFYIVPNMGELDEETTTNLKITVVFVFANFQYISSVVAFSISKPFRKPLWSNYPFFLAIIGLTLACLYVLLIPDPITAYWLGLVAFPLTFRLMLLAAAFVNSLVAWCLERFVVVALLSSADSR